MDKINLYPKIPAWVIQVLPLFVDMNIYSSFAALLRQFV